MPDLSNVQFRALRRATGLRQDDLAHLLGFKDSSSVSRFERLLREPDVRTAFACEYILGAQASALFASVFKDVARVVATRARERLDALSVFANDLRHADRLTHLSKLVERPRTLFDV
ncbi:MAG: helix-turn-helix transcriptional regulator [Hyphomonadaceae bacterium]